MDNYAKLVAEGKAIPDEGSTETLQQAFERVQKEMTFKMLNELRTDMWNSLVGMRVISSRRDTTTFTCSELWRTFQLRKSFIIKFKRIRDFFFGGLYQKKLMLYDELKEVRNMMWTYLVNKKVYMIPDERHKYSPGELWRIICDLEHSLYDK